MKRCTCRVPYGPGSPPTSALKASSPHFLPHMGGSACRTHLTACSPLVLERSDSLFHKFGWYIWGLGPPPWDQHEMNIFASMAQNLSFDLSLAGRCLWLSNQLVTQLNLLHNSRFHYYIILYYIIAYKLYSPATPPSAIVIFCLLSSWPFTFKSQQMQERRMVFIVAIDQTRYQHFYYFNIMEEEIETQRSCITCKRSLLSFKSCLSARLNPQGSQDTSHHVATSEHRHSKYCILGMAN